jgi:hypothetical protein
MRGKKKKVHHKRRRIGAASGWGVVIQKFVGIAGGAAGGMFLNQALKTAFTSLPAFAPGLVIAVSGIFVDKTMGKKSVLMSGVGEGLMAAGALIAVNETFISIPGISGVGFVTNYDKNYKASNKMMRAVGAPGFMDKSIGTVRDLASVGNPMMAGIYDS